MPSLASSSAETVIALSLLAGINSDVSIWSLPAATTVNMFFSRKESNSSSMAFAVDWL